MLRRIREALQLFTFKMKNNYYPTIFEIVYQQNPYYGLIGWDSSGTPIAIIDKENYATSIKNSRPISMFELKSYLDTVDNLVTTRVIEMDGDCYLLYFFTNSFTAVPIRYTVGTIDIFYTDDFNIGEFVKKLPKCKECKNSPAYYYVTVTPQGEFLSNYFNIKSNCNVDLTKNYNDDLPFNDLLEFCQKDTCGLTLLYGEPGCGKTTIIKNLIGKLSSSVDFLLLDASMLSNITGSKFLSYLMKNFNSVVILEDCEKLLMSREEYDNPWIGTLLNLTDGMLGEGLSIKFICTFNSNISSIDKALLREGRLDICYEFKKLFKEKAKVLCQEQNINCTGDMTLAQIYKTKIDNSTFNKPVRKVGF